MRGHLRLYVLDANALVSLLENRPVAASRVRHLLEEASLNEHPLLLSSINWGEVFYITWRLHGEEEALAAERQIQELPIAVIPIDRDRATRAATLKQKHNLGYADSFAAELAIEKKAWLVTADAEFARLGKALSVYALPRYEK